jgi:amino acid adenylation domain-containing protein
VKYENNDGRRAVLQQILEFNDTNKSFPDSTTIPEMFQAQVEQHASDVAVVCDYAKGSGSPPSLTYGQLNEQANQVANLLRKCGAGADDIIAIETDRSLAMVIGIMGILKAGAAYLPISPDNPAERTRYMLSDSGARILLIQDKSRARVPFDGQTIDLKSPEINAGEKGNPPSMCKPGNLAYVIYTSGSTGRPKGVMIEHRSVINRLNWMQRTYPLARDDVILQKTPFCFDVSVWELFWWSLYGAKMCLLRPGGEKNPPALIEAIETHRVSVLHFVPSMLNVFLEYLAGKATTESARLSSVRRVFASGEMLSSSHVRKFHQSFFSDVHAKLTNLYGPTEATVDVTYFDCPSEENCRKIPIGKPIDNTKIFILREGDLLGVGEAGELCISGVGLGRGYVNNQTLTDEKFVLNPYLPGQRLYRTGDIARWLPDGNIEYLGREDFQIKIRGLRIELGEIESTIREFPGIKDCVVVSKSYSESIALIFAYIVAVEGMIVEDLKQHLRMHLPDYMIPNQFVEIDAVPISPNGKADRKALPDPRFNTIK